MNVSRPVCEELQAFARRGKVTAFVVLLTALKAALWRFLNRRETAVGTFVVNRGTMEKCRVLGAHYNMVLVCTRVDGRERFDELMGRVQDDVIEALEHQRAPFAAVVSRMAQEPGWVSFSGPRIVLLLDRHPLQDISLAGCEVDPLFLRRLGHEPEVADRGPGAARLQAVTSADVTFFFREREAGMSVSVLYDEACADAGRIPALLAEYMGALEVLIRSPELPLSRAAFRAVSDLDAAEGVEDVYPGLGSVAQLSPVEALSPVVTGREGLAAAGRADAWD